MGLPVEGSAIDWDTTEKAGPSVQKWATEQLLCIWHKQRHRSDSSATWGDEIEYNLVDLDHDASRATMLLEQERVIREWERDPSSTESPVTLQWEGAKYVVETTPAKPYSESIEDLLSVQANMRKRRETINRSLASNQHTISIGSFPRAGVDGQWTTPQGPTQTSHSLCMLPRYRSLFRSIHGRRQGNPKKTRLYIHQDSQTTKSPPQERVQDSICLDHIEVGVGSSSLQTTFQTSNEAECRWLYDQLIPLAPVFLAMTAAVPIWKGYLVDTDVRWQRFGDIVDDRRPDEMEHTRLLDGDMDDQLATHFASILSRDPLVLTQDDMSHFNTSNTKLFELLHGCTWHSVRFKPPVSDSGPGWCVEFRTMEAQLTDRDNAAFAIFTYLLSRAIVALHLNFYIPIDKVGESMEFASKRNAVLDERLWFRHSGWLAESTHLPRPARSACKEKAQTRVEGVDSALLTADEIFNGEADHRGFPGLIPLVRYYLEYSEMPLAEQERIAPYLDVVGKRASGEMPTPASWMREFVSRHEDYRQDGYVDEKVCYDMMKEIVRMNEE
ncbi:Glutamate-cysteine ligase catalytic subunit [Penicillium nucicola]|uniref:Glutamate-cysteine ligase catalytic subunit n=1 Tax=Penicillium nucicola TaxID=1850975 RepID=UPI00254530ED|nr:Glutamate-cysteine ligase catalytic subunit [Penicillium nucicola]KAJ5761975.1 Glutamate-cysteine ligase catalytic subunit [Penicillium nucicola]